MPDKYETHITEYMEDDDPSSEPLDDNFDEEIKEKLPRPTSNSAIENAVEHDPEMIVTVWRGTTGARARQMEERGSAGGEMPRQDTEKPTVDEAQQQVKRGGVVPEFTCDPDKTGFSFGHFLVVVDIRAKYLRKGSGTESRWVAKHDAPVTVRAVVDRTYTYNGINSDTKPMPNAS